MRPSDRDDASQLDLSRRTLFDMTLSPIARLAGISTLGNLVDQLRREPATRLPRAEATTVTETSFFRDEHLFHALRATILPALIRRRTPAGRLRIWSAACSTGPEAFSLAILLAELIPDLTAWDIMIHATDISRQAIDCARRGHFRASEVQQGLTPGRVARSFTSEGDEWVVRPHLAALCDFRQVNLCAAWPPLPHFDLILLRNVLLYLSPADRSAVLTRMHGQLAPEGYLVLGESEQAEDSTSLFFPHLIGDTYVYRPIP